MPKALTLATTVSTLLLLAACGPQPVQVQSGDAAPAGSAEVTASAPATVTPTSPATSQTPSTAATTTKPAGGSLVLGPLGFGSLKLGMNRQQANATGMVVAFESTPASSCTASNLRDAPSDKGYVHLSAALGIAAIDAYNGSIRTPEGVHVGMSSADMRRIYPEWKPVDGDANNGRGGVWAPGGDHKTVYRIALRNGVITELTLQLRNQDCYE
ncbi:hypothetical protein AB0M46_05095 [Dactylosporangium sp. NPDC051485]|uniref:hypothetical protein n=1 Tax=Dactylosporangium sp. NPDC051485 TaxID=3154846 RepID=UPI00341F08B9